MPIYLRQSTTSQEVPLGYFVDSTDGNTEETGLTIANTDIKLWKSGATSLANKNSGGATHMANGVYYAVLDDTDTNTIGPLVVFVHVSGALAVRVECCVLDEAVYDVWFGTTAPATATNITSATGVDVTKWSGTSVPSPDTAGYPKVTVKSGTGTGEISLSGGRAEADVTYFGGAAGTFSGGRPEVNTTHWGGTAVASAVVSANAVQISGDATAADNLEASADGTGYNLGAGQVVAASVTGNVGGNVSGSVGSVSSFGTLISDIWTAFNASVIAKFFTVDTTKVYADAVTGSVVKEIASNAGGGGSTTVPQILGAVSKSGSTYKVDYVLTLNGAVQTSGLGTLSVTFLQAGTDLGYSGSPAADATGVIRASGTLTTAPTDNVPIMVKVAVTKSSVAYSTTLPAVNIA